MREFDYIESEGLVVNKVTYDAEPALIEAERARQQGGVKVGSKGQEMLLACVLPLEHIEAVKNETGYDLLSPDPEQWRRALVYIQQHQSRFMATDKKVFDTFKPKWQ